MPACKLLITWTDPQGNTQTATVTQTFPNATWGAIRAGYRPAIADAIAAFAEYIRTTPEPEEMSPIEKLAEDILARLDEAKELTRDDLAKLGTQKELHWAVSMLLKSGKVESIPRTGGAVMRRKAEPIEPEPKERLRYHTSPKNGTSSHTHLENREGTGTVCGSGGFSACLRRWLKEANRCPECEAKHTADQEPNSRHMAAGAQPTPTNRGPSNSVEENH